MRTTLNRRVTKLEDTKPNQKRLVRTSDFWYGDITAVYETVEPFKKSGMAEFYDEVEKERLLHGE
jgi:hypothetical protein